MATKTFEELKQLAIQIRDEKTNKQNTATRIGTQMLEHLDKLEQDYYDKTATDEELQARDEKLTELEKKVGGVGYVTCDTAAGTAAKVVTITGLTTLTTGIRLLVKMTNNNTAGNATLNVNNLGQKPLFYNNIRVSESNSWGVGEIIDIYYDGTNFYSGNFQGGSEEDALILEWKTDVATTRNSVPYNKRKKGLKISYPLNNLYWIEERFIGNELNYNVTNNNYWGNEKYWIRDINSEEVYSKLLSVETTNSKNLFNPNKLVKGFFVNSQGVLANNDSYGYVDIPFNGKNLTINISGTGGFCCIIDRNGLIKNVTNQQVGTTLSYEEGLLYGRFSFRISDSENVQIEYGDTVTEYEPYDGFQTKSQIKSLIQESIRPDGEDSTDYSIICSYRNRCNPSEIKYGVWLNSKGEEQSNAQFATTGYIPIQEGEKLYINIDSKLEVIYNVIYDKDKNMIEVHPASEGRVLSYIENAYFVRYTINLSETAYKYVNMLSVMVSTEEHSVYVDYGEPKLPILGNFYADYLIIPVYGQSLSLGYGTVLTTDNESYNNVTQNNGISGNSTDFTSIEPIPKDTGNTVAQQVSQYVGKLLQDTEYADTSIFTVSKGAGGQPIRNLISCTDLLNTIKKAADYAIFNGKSVNVPTLVWIQGEADQENTYEYYMEMMSTMIRYFNEKVKEITGQNNDVIFSCYQTGSYEAASNETTQSEIPKVQYDLSISNPLYKVMSAIYALPFNTDQLHLNAIGSRQMGATIAYGIVRMLYKGGWNPLCISDISVYKTSEYASTERWMVRIVMDAPVFPIVFDESPKYYDYGDLKNSVVIPHKGFELKKEENDIIENVTISQGRVINIVTTQDPTGCTLYYAKRGNQGGGYVRDSQGDEYKCMVNGSEYRCDNWLPIFNVTL